MSPKYEHVSRYFNEIGFTLYGAVLTFHAEDLGDSAFEGVGGFSGSEAKQKLLGQYATEKPGEPALVTITLAIVSTDLTHNPAFVQHVNDNIITPFAKQHAAPGVKFTVHYVDSDGCPNQFDLADQYLWISGQQERHGIRMDWSLNCPCHGKALSDPEMGAAKAMVAGEQLRHSEDDDHLIESVAQVVAVLRRKYSHTDRSIFQKKLAGILRRFVFFVPSTGPESANQRIRKCNTLEGSKPLRQFTDIGEYGKLQIRHRSCHLPCCIALDTANCAVKDKCGESQLVKLNPLSEPKPHLGRNALSMEGAEIGENCDDGDVIAVEVPHDEEHVMIGLVVPALDGSSGMSQVTEDDILRLHVPSSFQPGDRAVYLRKFEPTQAGSSLFKLTEKTLPVLIEDIRLRIEASDFREETKEPPAIKMGREEGTPGLSLRTTPITDKFERGKLYRLSPAVKETLLLKIPRDVAAILRFRSRDRRGDDDSSEDDDDDEGGRGSPAAPDDAEMALCTADGGGSGDVDVDVGCAIAPASFGIVRLAHMSKFGAELQRSKILFKWNAGEADDEWAQGVVWKREPSKADLRKCPSANAIVRFAFGAVACELSKETYGVEQKWVLLRKLG